MHRTKIKSRKYVEEEVTNLVEHLAQQRLFQISNEADTSELEFKNAEEPHQSIRKSSPISRSTMLQTSGKQARENRFLSPLPSRNTTRRMNIINYSHTSMPTVKNYEIKDQKGNTVYVGSLKQQQYWFEPLKNFTKFVILDNRQAKDDAKKNSDAMPVPRVNKSLYRNSLFRKTKDERGMEINAHSAIFDLPKPEDFITNHYRPAQHVIHSIYNDHRNYGHEDPQRRTMFLRRN